MDVCSEITRCYNDSEHHIDLILVSSLSNVECYTLRLGSIKPGDYLPIISDIFIVFEDPFSPSMYLTVGGERKMCITKDDLRGCNELRFICEEGKFSLKQIKGNYFGRLGISWVLKDYFKENRRKALNKRTGLREPLLKY